MAKFLTQLWKLCGRLGATPKVWDKITLFPIYKKGDRDRPNNYRPISLMSHVRKIIEKAVDSQLRREKEFSAAQCGFKPYTGTDNALLRFLHATEISNRISWPSSI